MNNSIAILVCSCDKYKDVWGPMFEMFFKFWPDCPFNIYLMANHEKYDDPRVVTLNTGDDISWSIGFRKAINIIQEENILIVMEDYILQKKVNNSDFYDLVDYMNQEHADAIRIYPSLYANEPKYGVWGSRKIGIVKKNDQAGMWKKQYVLSIIDDKDSAWEFEHLGSKRSKIDGSKILCTLDKEDIIFDYYCTGVIQGYWIKEAVDLCKQYGITVDLDKRPIETELIRKKRIHSERDFVKVKNFLKKTIVYDLYRAHKFGKRV